MECLIVLLSSKNEANAVFAFDVLTSLTLFGLRKHVPYLKLTIDSIHDMQPKSVTCLLQLFVSLFDTNLQRDSFVFEFLIVLKKQINSKNSKFSKIGVEGIFLIIEKFAFQPEAFEGCNFVSTPCASQAATGGLSENQIFCFELLKFVISCAKSCGTIMKIVLPYFVKYFSRFTEEFAGYIEDELVEYLKNLFFVDLQEEKVSERMEIFDLSNKTSPIAISIHDDNGAVLPFFVQLLTSYSKKVNGNLDEIDALLYCSIFIDQNRKDIKENLRNYLISLINAFGICEQFLPILFERFKQLVSLDEIQLGNHNQVVVDKIKKSDTIPLLRQWIEIGKEIRKDVILKKETPDVSLKLNQSVLVSFFGQEELVKNMQLACYFLGQLTNDSNIPVNQFLDYFYPLMKFVKLNDKCSIQVAKMALLILLDLLQIHDKNQRTISNCSGKNMSSGKENISNNLSEFINIDCENISTTNNDESCNEVNEKSQVDNAIMTDENTEFKVEKSFLDRESVKIKLAELGILDKIGQCRNLSREFINLSIVLHLGEDKLSNILMGNLTLKEHSPFSKEDIGYFTTKLLCQSSGKESFVSSFDSLVQIVQSNEANTDAILEGIFEFLCDSSTDLKLTNLQERMQCFYLLMNSIKAVSNQLSLMLKVTKMSKRYIDFIIKFAVPIIRRTLSNEPVECVECLKILQQGTRILHSICLCIKENSNSAVTHIASLKKMLEMLIIEVKNLLVANGCISAFWMGNLKQKNLQGETLLSQVQP